MSSHQHTVVHVQSCCNGHACGKCECCQSSASSEKDPKKKKNHNVEIVDGWRWRHVLPWIIASILLGLTVLFLLYVIWDLRQAPYVPHWSSSTSQPEPDKGIVKAAGAGSVSADGGFEAAVTSGARAATRLAANNGGERAAGSAEANIDQGVLDLAVALLKAVADGSPIADQLLRGLPLTKDENEELPTAFIDSSEKYDGVRGFYRLAFVHLGDPAFELAKASDRRTAGKGLYVPFARQTKFGITPDTKLAYVYFAFIAQQCQMIVGRPDVQPWMDAIKASHAVPKPNFDDWDTEAAEAFDELMASVNLDPENQDDRRKFCGGIPIDAPPPPTSCDNTNNARQALKLGDAAQANDNTEKARACWRRSISLAQEDPEDRDGAEAAMEAERRLKTFTSTCKINEESLAAISRDYKARSGDLLSVKVLQQSLTALGQYDGPIDGELTEATREAIRKFQGDRDEDKTGMLSPEQTVRLVCTAAESTSDNVSQTTLGIMNATGLGVQPDRDLALNWLKKAEGRNYPDAKYNLAIIYGTGIVLDSYRLCDVARAPEQADKFLQEAARLKHPIALALMKLYGPGSRYEALTPAERWQLIESQQLERSNQDKTGLYAQRLRNIGAQCGPDRSIR